MVNRFIKVADQIYTVNKSLRGPIDGCFWSDAFEDKSQYEIAAHELANC